MAARVAERGGRQGSVETVLNGGQGRTAAQRFRPWFRSKLQRPSVRCLPLTIFSLLATTMTDEEDISGVWMTRLTAADVLREEMRRRWGERRGSCVGLHGRKQEKGDEKIR